MKRFYDNQGGTVKKLLAVLVLALLASACGTMTEPQMDQATQMES